MFLIHHIKDHEKGENYIELKNSNNLCYAKIDLKLGGSLQELKLDNKILITSKDVLPYKNSYASAILFPFANRIKKGTYTYNGKKYQLQCNEANKKNAIHGLVYNKEFELVKYEVKSKSASVYISYNENEVIEGFPFTYKIVLHYILTNDALTLNVEVKNTYHISFPFSLGWHPYFKTSDLSNSTIKIESNRKISHIDNIPFGEEEIQCGLNMKIANNTYDDCFVLNSNTVVFKTPEYHLDFSFSKDNKYLQIYTPDNRKSIAIEPQTAPANSFNNKIGLKTLNPGDTYNLSWKIKLK